MDNLGHIHIRDLGNIRVHLTQTSRSLDNSEHCVTYQGAGQVDPGPLEEAVSTAIHVYPGTDRLRCGHGTNQLYLI